MNFKADNDSTELLQPPYFEDARADIAPGYGTSISIDRLQAEIVKLLVRLGAGGIYFQSGRFEGVRSKPLAVRYGYVIRFNVQGHPHQMQVAALPIRSETAVRKQQALRQALFVVRDQLKAAVTAIVFAPGSTPLVPYMLVPGTQQTVGEYILASASVPNMNPTLPGRIVDAQGEVVE